ncbi:UDP-N-acetylglucosamine acyltransferase [Ereboglobus sp. PH5-10]|uniref:acyl-ACP--UDP-N-acetylglucosamine O-acyltransferase n=1 Tax=Ereboglobus sp. PH5-10 TaxID=2940629 RepID=UPI002406EAF7|nr:acyl-ACP--UDP-N-acetylglucosamine O-acyltransferase [Ereboglobus sp. PH5-10]MDF9826069.1 UDP-N-acetylglucosamine acyltransferase [Ereboglobus sp. PH5-10]
MPTLIHPSAVVEPGAQLGDGVEIGPFAYIGAQVRLGDGTRVRHHGTVEGNTHLGKNCDVFPYAYIGAKTQDLKYKGGNPGVRIGDGNTFREFVSVHGGTNDGEHTILGNNNLVLCYAHIAHDCVLGNNIIMSGYAGLAGHVTVEDHVVFGANSGVHQFCRIGAYVMLGGYSKIVQDIAPFMIADGNPAVIRTINKIGLERNGFTPGQIERVKQAYRILFRDGLNRTQAMEKLTAHEHAQTPEFQRIMTFAGTSDRGLAPGAA